MNKKNEIAINVTVETELTAEEYKAKFVEWVESNGWKMKYSSFVDVTDLHLYDDDYWDEAADWDCDEDEDEDYRELERLTRCIGCGKGNIWCECDPDNPGKWDFNFLANDHPYKGSFEEEEHIVHSMETLKEKIKRHLPLTRYEVKVWEKHRRWFKPEWFEEANPFGFVNVNDLFEPIWGQGDDNS